MGAGEVVPVSLLGAFAWFNCFTLSHACSVPKPNELPM